MFAQRKSKQSQHLGRWFGFLLLIDEEGEVIFCLDYSFQLQVVGFDACKVVRSHLRQEETSVHLQP